MARRKIKINRFLPYSRQFIDEEDIRVVSNVLKENLITQGPKIASFEKSFAKYVGSKFAVACAHRNSRLTSFLSSFEIRSG